ncbi:hypothetical protein Dsin_027724 [Dipteronia sinensis]|uniref:Bulb-type lectin domain-containing protein n=1 Tax=Dipteronia sinensis TaxID=43782 RepID=A0AAD9ZPA4_9ROSI|nr:hypothetical protein Dsin_027724 [Dipteronia sinensis]
MTSATVEACEGRRSEMDARWWNCQSAIDTITASRSIKDPETITSKGSAFILGFFNPEDGNLVVLNGQNEVLWSSNVSNSVTHVNAQNEVLWSSNVSNSVTNVSAQLNLDTGNLVLDDITIGIRIWESFQEPTDTFLAGMKLSSHMRTGPIVQLRSWKSLSDPSPGSFSFGIGSSNIPEGFIWNDSQVYWRTGPWNGLLFIGIPNMISSYLDGYTLLADDRTGSVNFSYSIPNTPMFILLTSLGIVEHRERYDEKNDWEVIFLSRKTECDVYGRCGAFGNCNPQKTPICRNLRGFEPNNMEEWSRKRPLQCERINQTGDVAKEDVFLKLEMMKVPYFMERSPIQKKDNKVVVIVPVVAGIITCAICTFFLWRWMAKHKALKDKSWALFLGRDDTCIVENLNEVELQDLPLFDFEKLASATNNFHLSNKLGMGGFGPVYKVTLAD